MENSFEYQPFGSDSWQDLTAYDGYKLINNKFGRVTPSLIQLFQGEVIELENGIIRMKKELTLKE